MTIEQTKSAIAVMQAFVDRLEIETKARSGTKWYPSHEPAWNWCESEFRIKPTPIEGWVNVYPGLNGPNLSPIFASKEVALLSCSTKAIKTIKVREVEE